MDFISAFLLMLRFFLLKLVVATVLVVGGIGLLWVLFWKCYLRKLPIVQDLVREFRRPQGEKKGTADGTKLATLIDTGNIAGMKEEKK